MDKVAKSQAKQPRVRTLEELRALIAEYKALPDNFLTQLHWSGYDRRPAIQVTCCECGTAYSTQTVGIDEAVRWVEEGKFLTQVQGGYCGSCPKDTDGEEGSGEEE